MLQTRRASTLASAPRHFARLVAATRAAQALWMLFLEARFWLYEHSYVRFTRGQGGALKPWLCSLGLA